MSHKDRFGFVLAQSRLQHHRRTIARFVCSRCSVEAEVKPRMPLNPEEVAKRCERDFGWQADGYRKSVARCPNCLAKKVEGDRPEKEVKDMEHLKKAGTDTLRDPTPQERQRIRALLDKQFDDAAGCYLDGYSDQKIGADLNLPWAMVTKIREAAYGPIKVDPEVAGLRAELSDLRRKIDALTQAHNGAIERLAGIEKKRGAA